MYNIAPPLEVYKKGKKDYHYVIKNAVACRGIIMMVRKVCSYLVYKKCILF